MENVGVSPWLRLHPVSQYLSGVYRCFLTCGTGNHASFVDMSGIGAGTFHAENGTSKRHRKRPHASCTLRR